MAQQMQQWQSDRGDAWLSSLVKTFQQVDRLEQLPCDDTLRSAIKARLSRPASPMPSQLPISLRPRYAVHC